MKLNHLIFLIIFSWSSELYSKTVTFDCGNYARTGVQNAINQMEDNDVIYIIGRCEENLFIGKSIYITGKGSLPSGVGVGRAAIINGKVKLVRGRTKFKNLYIYGTTIATDNSTLVSSDVTFDDRAPSYAVTIRGSSHADIVNSTTFGPIEVAANSSVNITGTRLAPQNSTVGSTGSIIDLSGGSYGQISEAEYPSDGPTLVSVKTNSVLEIVGGDWGPYNPGGNLGVRCTNSILQFTNTPFTIESTSLPLENSCVFSEISD